MNSPESPVPARIAAFAARMALALGVWWIIAEAAPGSLIVGVPAAALAAWLGLRLDPSGRRPIRLLQLPGFAWFFLSRSLVAGIDVAWRTVQRRPRLAPTMLEFTTPDLPDASPRWLLANMLSLMPGTLSVISDGPRLQLHCLYEDGIAEQVRAAEQRVARLFGLPTPGAGTPDAGTPDAATPAAGTRP